MSPHQNARQHVTAGPYSPVLEVDARHLRGDCRDRSRSTSKGIPSAATIEEQTLATLRNCAGHLATAGCSLADVFKVNIYLTDLGGLGAVSTPSTRSSCRRCPVRTAVQAILLPGYLVEIEMWAVKAKG